MRLLDFLLVNCTLVCCLWSGTVQCKSVSDSRPNVVLVLIDNQSYFELSRNGHPIVRTPRMDRLADEGVNFTDFNAPPFCSPSRAELLTGRYALRSGIHNTIGGVSILNRNETTIADIMKQAGYRTAIFGKWHLGYDYPYDPQYRGFDEVFIHGGGGMGQLPDYYGNTHLNATFKHNGLYVKSRGYSTDVLFDQGIDFIGRNREGPFFCYIATPAVHFPTLKHPEVAQRLLDRGVPDSENLAIYSMIENVDDNIGRLLDYLEEIGIKDNTLLILASDQGVNDRGAVEHRAGDIHNRSVAFDEYHQVYCMIQYPKLTDQKPGQRDELAGMVDIMPTILDVCGIAMPTNLDGQSLKPLLGAKSNGWNNERKLIVQCPRQRERSKWVNASVKYKTWRLVEGKELYNIADDYGEKVNLINKHPELDTDLKKTYESFWSSLAPADELLSPLVIGSPEAPAVRLDAMDWYRGDAPWTHGSMDNKTSQGVWLIEIVRDGHYRFELRRYPREASKPVGATKAAIKIGQLTTEVSMDENDKKAILEMDLKKGKYDMQTFFEDSLNTDKPRQWGAYFAYISYDE